MLRVRVVVVDGQVLGRAVRSAGTRTLGGDNLDEPPELVFY